MVQQSQRLLMGADFPQPQIHLDLTPVELAVYLGSPGFELSLRLLFDFLARHQRLAFGNLDQGRRLFVRIPPSSFRAYSHHKKTRHRAEQHRPRPWPIQRDVRLSEHMD